MRIPLWRLSTTAPLADEDPPVTAVLVSARGLTGLLPGCRLIKRESEQRELEVAGVGAGSAGGTGPRRWPTGRINNAGFYYHSRAWKLRLGQKNGTALKVLAPHTELGARGGSWCTRPTEPGPTDAARGRARACSCVPHVQYHPRGLRARPKGPSFPRGLASPPADGTRFAALATSPDHQPQTSSPCVFMSPFAS